MVRGLTLVVALYAVWYYSIPRALGAQGSNPPTANK